MKRFFFWNVFLYTLLATLTAGTFIVLTVHADISVSGDINPADPATWTIETDAYIGYENTGTMTITAGYSVNDGSAYLGYESSASGTVTVDGAYSRWGNDTNLFVGNSGTGTIRVINGGIVSGDNAYLGYDSDASGEVFVGNEGGSRGSSCDWYYLYAGFHGTGTLEITNGSEVTNFYAYLGYHAEASGTVTVDGEESTWNPGDLFAGNSGTGIIQISNGGMVTDSNAYLGYYSGSSGTVSVDGVGSTWNNFNLSVGHSGTGILNITNGGTVTHDSINRCYLGYDTDANGTVTVDGQGSTWSIFDRLRLGRYGSGTVNITNGGTVTCEITGLGIFPGGNGEVIIDGEGSTWNNSDSFSVGSEGMGALTITNGGTLTSDHVILGYETNASGTVVVDGIGSTWTNNGGFDVGYNGIGTLTVSNGGAISDDSTGNIGRYPTASGTVNIIGIGSTWTNKNRLYIGGSGTGIMNISGGGTLTSEDVYLGHSIGANGTLTVDGEGSSWINTGDLELGSEGIGELVIANGGNMTSYNGRIGNGTITVDGEGSMWRSDSGLQIAGTETSVMAISNGGTVVVSGDSFIGSFSYSPVIKLTIDGQGSTLTNSGMLDFYSNGPCETTIINGGAITSSTGSIFAMNSSTITVAVNGEGSNWAVSDGLSLSYYGIDGASALSITNGGLVSANTVSLGNTIFTVDVNSTLNVGTIDNDWTGDIYNDGTLRLVANVGVNAGTYTPVHYSTMAGGGIVQTLGGTWDTDLHTITVSSVVMAQGSGGATAPINLLVQQRALITDSDTIDSDTIMVAGAGFPTADVSTEISLTATVVDSENLATLENLISETGEKILSAWDFSVSGYDVSANSPIYLSLFAGGATDILDLNIWHYANGEWSKYETTDLAFDGIYASFVAGSLGGYAVTKTANIFYLGDFEKDGDIDGSDIFYFISTQEEISIEEFASTFGRND